MVALPGTATPLREPTAERLRPSRVAPKALPRENVGSTVNHRFLLGRAIALAIVAPRAAAFGYLVIAVVGVLRVRGDEVTPEAA